MTLPRYVIFRCDQDNAWIVSARSPGPQRDVEVYRGVAECPDEKTARIVHAAMRARETDEEGPSDPRMSPDTLEELTKLFFETPVQKFAMQSAKPGIDGQVSVSVSAVLDALIDLKDLRDRTR